MSNQSWAASAQPADLTKYQLTFDNKDMQGIGP
jgi:hypothetical protein